MIWREASCLGFGLGETKKKKKHLSVQSMSFMCTVKVLNIVSESAEYCFVWKGLILSVKVLEFVLDYISAVCRLW